MMVGQECVAEGGGVGAGVCVEAEMLPRDRMAESARAGVVILGERIGMATWYMGGRRDEGEALQEGATG